MQQPPAEPEQADLRQSPGQPDPPGPNIPPIGRGIEPAILEQDQRAGDDCTDRRHPSEGEQPSDGECRADPNDGSDVVGQREVQDFVFLEAAEPGDSGHDVSLDRCDEFFHDEFYFVVFCCQIDTLPRISRRGSWRNGS